MGIPKQNGNFKKTHTVLNKFTSERMPHRVHRDLAAFFFHDIRCIQSRTINRLLNRLGAIPTFIAPELVK